MGCKSIAMSSPTFFGSPRLMVHRNANLGGERERTWTVVSLFNRAVNKGRRLGIFLPQVLTLGIPTNATTFPPNALYIFSASSKISNALI